MYTTVCRAIYNSCSRTAGVTAVLTIANNAHMKPPQLMSSCCICCKRPCKLQYTWLYEDYACFNHLLVSLNQSKSAATAFKTVLRAYSTSGLAIWGCTLYLKELKCLHYYYVWITTVAQVYMDFYV